MDFISGILEENTVAGYHNGSSIGRSLVVRHATGYRLSIFDAAPDISADLIVGTRVQLLVAATTLSALNHLPGLLSHAHVDRWSGIILEPEWLPGQAAQCRIAKSQLYDNDNWALIRTALGQLVMRRDEVQMETYSESLHMGAFLQWQYARLDLLAVI